MGAGGRTGLRLELPLFEIGSLLRETNIKHKVRTYLILLFKSRPTLTKRICLLRDELCSPTELLCKKSSL